MPSVPMMKMNGDDRPALPAIRAEMKITPIVGEMNASDIAIALGSPSALRRNWLSVTSVGGEAEGGAVAMAHAPWEDFFVNCKERSRLRSRSSGEMSYFGDGGAGSPGSAASRLRSGGPLQDRT